MPDLITHLGAGYILADLRGYDKAIFLLGSILPDLKMLYRLLEPFVPDQVSYGIFYAFDAPIIFIPLALFFSLFFRERANAFKFLAYGVLIHIGLDGLQYKFGGGIPLFYPFSFERYSLGLFWQNNYLVTVISAISVLALITYKKRWMSD